MNPSSANTQKTTALKIKELGGRWPRKRASKGCTQRQKGALQHPKQNQKKHCTRTERKIATE